MRIICPNCDAQYEVPDDIIPEEGRDVQCSNCGQTWFQEHKDAIAARTASEATEDDALDQPDVPAEDEEYIETPVAPAMSEASRKKLDPEVADILRQEGEREAAARAADTSAGGLEMQPDLGLPDSEDEATKRAREARDRMSKIRGENQEAQADLAAQESRAPRNAARGSVGEAAATAAALDSRRELLPDIEEINSTLRSTGDRAVAGADLAPDAPIKARKRRGFRRGFLIALVLFTIAVLIYVFAPQIAEAFPPANPALTSYVTWVDGLRSGLDARVQEMLQWLDRAAAESSAN
ncbi:hypothetical protein E4Z66_13345 [Aliishimia ponticola]|uniref:Zinc finger/thioredoxin putative domain-containing protein n=1 Tax=Aliishimia ponticola TaxID=2499833 RepID=A0A4S4NBJ6_9RHOB|nr:zinc-ribbon domain-containing protein [Aliishimia ponticola]THH36045.1 hypothetical protein E4Z66_13345 [Aliishimia ponticola]